MSEARLRTSIWVQALIWRCSQAGANAVVVKRGDPDAGALLIKLNSFDNSYRLMQRVRALNGDLKWNDALPDRGPLMDSDIDTYIARESKRDPDLWVIEISDRNPERFLQD